MVIFGATTAFFILFLEVQFAGKQTKILGGHCKPLVDKKKTLSYTYYILKDENLDIVPYKEHEDPTENIQYLCTESRYLALCTLKLLPSDVCLDFSAILDQGFMDVLSRLPPPGGTTALDILNTVLIPSHHMSFWFLKEIKRSSLSFVRVDIIFDADYEAVLGARVGEFHHLLLQHLRRIFQRSQSNIHTLKIKKGSIGISFFVNLMNCDYSTRMGNPCLVSVTNEGHVLIEYNGKGWVPYETEFLRFLKYLNYHMTLQSKLTRIPHSIKMSFKGKSRLESEKPNLFEIKTDRKNTATNLFLTMHSDLKYDRLTKTGVLIDQGPSSKSVEEVGRYAKVNVQDDNSEIEPLKNEHHQRVRRYVSSEEEFSMKLKISFQLENPTMNGNQNEFQRHLISQLAKAMRIPIPSINDMKILSDTDVSFTLSAFNDANNVMDDLSVIEAADSLKTKIKSRQLRLTDLNGQLLMTAGSAYATLEDLTYYSIGVLVLLCIISLILIVLVITVIYIARRTSNIPKSSSGRNEAYSNFHFGRDSSQSIGKYSYDSGLWLGPGPEPSFTVPDAPYYRPPTVEQVSSTPRPVTAVRTRLKRNWNVDERALSTIPDDFRRSYGIHEDPR